jgi:AraC-like DNA-binding protein
MTTPAGVRVETGRRDNSGVVALGNYAFRTDDLDEAVEFVSRNFAEHSRVARGRGPLGYRVLAAFSGRCAGGVSSSAMSTVVRTASRSILLHLPLHHGAEYRVGRRTLHSATDVTVMLCPGHAYTVVTPPGDTLALLLEPSLLEREIDALRVRRPGSWTLKSMRIFLSPADIALLRDLLQRHGAAVTRTQLTGLTDELWAIEDQMAAWLARQVIEAEGHVPLSPSNREIVQRVDGWIRQHFRQPITLDQLQAAAGVSARTLQEACLAYWGQTPLELVVARRLEAAREMLAAGTASTVTDAAVHCGFSHLGRFSITYRRAFGESPSETLALASQ